MTKMAFRTLAATVLALAIARPASANITLDVNASLKYGGTLTGTLTFTSPSLTTLASYDLTVSAGPGSPGYKFPGFEYDLSTATVTAKTSTLIQFDSKVAGEELRLVFANALTASGATLSTSSYESEIVAGNRTVTSGAVTAVPEPATIVLASSSLAIVCGAAWVRRRRGGDGRRRIA